MTKSTTAEPRRRVTHDYDTGMAPIRAAWSPEGHEFAAALAAELDFQNRLRHARLALHLTQAQAARITGEDQADISRMERGAFSPSVRRVTRYLNALREDVGDGDTPEAAPALDRQPLIRVEEAARYFLTIQDEEDAITDLKLQKLLYYAQGYALALYGQPLFRDRIKAWDHGPVVPGVWQTYKEHAESPIPLPSDFDALSVSPKSRAILDRVYAEMGQYQAGRLREMTHQERPWKETERNKEIPIEVMAAFFSERLGLTRP
jgi:uncharacterized phage-associated protein